MFYLRQASSAEAPHLRGCSKIRASPAPGAAPLMARGVVHLVVALRIVAQLRDQATITGPLGPRLPAAGSRLICTASGGSARSAPSAITSAWPPASGWAVP